MYGQVYALLLPVAGEISCQYSVQIADKNCREIMLGSVVTVEPTFRLILTAPNRCHRRKTLLSFPVSRLIKIDQPYASREPNSLPSNHRDVLALSKMILRPGSANSTRLNTVRRRPQKSRLID